MMLCHLWWLFGTHSMAGDGEAGYCVKHRNGADIRWLPTTQHEIEFSCTEFPSHHWDFQKSGCIDPMRNVSLKNKMLTFWKS